MIKVKTLPIVSLTPVKSDIGFLNNFTNRDYTIRVSNKTCHECYDKQYVKDDYETYCNNCGNIYETRYYNYKTLFGAYGFSYEFIRFLKQESMQLKAIETQLKNIEPDYNKKYRDFKYNYYKLFIKIAMKEYHIHHIKDAEDLFYTMFRAYYEMNKKRGLKRTNLIHKFLDKLNINHRDYFIMGVNQEKQTSLYNLSSAVKGDYGYFDDDDFHYQAGASRTPIISEGQLNVTGKVFSCRHISYQLFRKVNNYPDNSKIMFKYINRYCKNYTLLEPNHHYTPAIWDKSSVAEPVTPVPTLNEDYVPFNSLGLKKKRPYYSTNLNNYRYTNKPENKHTEEKTENPHTENSKNKTEIKTIGGTLMTERMNKHPYRDRIYQLKLTICKNCPKASRLLINKKHRQYLCSCVKTSKIHYKHKVTTIYI